MRRNTPKNDSKKRTILTVSCIVLAIVCVLLLPITCSTERTPDPMPIPSPSPVPTPITPSKEKSGHAPSDPGSSSQTGVNNPGYEPSEPGTPSQSNGSEIEYTIPEPEFPSRNRDDRSKVDAEGSGASTQPRRGNTSNNQSKSGPLVRSEESITNHDPYYNEPSYQSQGDGQGKLAISISVLVVLLVSYVVAKVKSKDGELVITANTIDKILILTAPVLCFIAWCPGIDHELSAFQVTLFSLSGLMLQGSIIFSITANKGNILNISLSIMAKLFIFILTFFLLLLFVAILVITFMLSAMSHSRYEETYVVKYDHFLDQWVGYRID